jgi:guanylate kinase
MSRIIIIGPSCSGKSYMKEKFVKCGFKPDVSYTTRPTRKNEIDSVDYNFITVSLFETFIDRDFFIEFAKYDGDYYGSSREGFEENDIFIKEIDGIKKLSLEDREESFIIYLNIPKEIRIQRMKDERNWDDEKINRRLKEDDIKFNGFDDFDVEITNFK